MQGLVAVGTSMGGMSALEKILPLFPNDFLWPIAVVQHRHSDSDKYFLSDLAKRCVLKVCEAEDKQPALPGTIFS
jgi:two-component system, chemotaxis family, protein-glutamate methylesterase/glutaminase